MKILKNFFLENSINWNLAKVLKINDFSIKIQIDNNEIGKILLENISWTKKDFNTLFKIGDIIYVQRIKKNFWELKQLPEVNGSIVVMDPYTGRVFIYGWWF